MKTLIVDRTQLVKAVMQLTHAEIDPTQWPWVAAFDATAAQPTVQLRLPDQINSQGGFHTLRREGEPEQPESAAGLPEPVVTTPLAFADVGGFHWQGEMPDFDNPATLRHEKMQSVIRQIETRLRSQVEVDDETYKVIYQ